MGTIQIGSAIVLTWASTPIKISCSVTSRLASLKRFTPALTRAFTHSLARDPGNNIGVLVPVVSQCLEKAALYRPQPKAVFGTRSAALPSDRRRLRQGAELRLCGCCYEPAPGGEVVWQLQDGSEQRQKLGLLAFLGRMGQRKASVVEDGEYENENELPRTRPRPIWISERIPQGAKYSLSYEMSRFKDKCPHQCRNHFSARSVTDTVCPSLRTR
ncbi:hypothetical protein CH63R_02036 [Colletotrichum higginsianum IMI 349063]|uniref:Uncharacterized protein n=1 Tax=Colletotrichum higginsianum (strain IMI 349063) TaxID=759273 RepID=A0A1B7YMN8_COLHI|nr:hypothetical protein CH63R_02036 [Colletotrichum higginsianum IMI 349063]OBR13310.1 hypothetical protein CH63R_02036 [Colletotrichum higginsianum IMI 349063]